METVEIAVVEKRIAEATVPVAETLAALASEGSAITVVDAETCELANDFVKRAAAAVRDAEDPKRPLNAFIAALDKAHKSGVAMRNSIITPLKIAMDKVRINAKSWLVREEMRRQEEQRKIEAELRKKAEEEARKTAEEAQLRAAVEAESVGDVDLANTILEQEAKPGPVIVPVVVIQSQAPKVDGRYFREVWNVEVTSLEKLVAGIVEGKVPIQAVTPDLAWLRRQTKLSDGLRYPGVRSWKE